MEKKLFRSKTQRVFGGVCGGMAEYFNVDVTLVRLIWIIVSIALLHVGGGILIYIIAWIIIPQTNPYVETKDYTVDGGGAGRAQQPGMADADATEYKPDMQEAKAGVEWEDTQPGSSHPHGDAPEVKSNGPMVVGLIFIILGAFIIARRYLAPLWFFRFLSWGNIWPILLIIIGLVIVIRGFAKRK